MSESDEREEVRVQALQHLGRGEAVERAVLQDVAELAPSTPRPAPRAHDVADHEHDPPVAERTASYQSPPTFRPTPPGT